MDDRKVIDIHVLRMNRNIGKRCTCEGRGFVVDPDNREVTCSMCGAVVDPYEAMYELACKPERLMKEIEDLKRYKAYKQEELQKLVKKKPTGALLKEFERELKRGMIPVCPECHCGFFVEDIDMWTDRAMEEARRERGKS